MRRIILLAILLLAVNVSIPPAGLGVGSVSAPREGVENFSEPAESSVTDTFAANNIDLDSTGFPSPKVDSLTPESQVVDSLVADTVAQETAGEDTSARKADIIPMEKLRVVENTAFGPGEKLVFEISYGPIKAGTAIMEVKGIVPLNGRDCYHVVSTAKSNKVFSTFYKVEDRVESFFDAKGLFTWKFVQHLREGKYRADRFADYDQVNHTVTTNKGTMDTPPYVQDVLSTMYFVRTQSIEVGQVMYVDNHSGRKIYPLAVKVHRRELVKVPSGKFDCFVVEPMLKAGGLFKHEGRIWVWLTADEKRLPVLMKTKVIIGTVDAKLKSYRLGEIS